MRLDALIGLAKTGDLAARLGDDDALAPRLAALAPALAALGTAPAAPVHAFHVPGRIEVLGKHTDYAGGRSLLAACRQGFTLLATARDDRRLRLHDTVRQDTVEVEIDADAALPSAGWALYPATVARRLARDFPGAALRGADIAFASDLPAAAGMSSSSALVVATFLALAAAGDLARQAAYRAHLTAPEARADYLGAVEGGKAFAAFAGDRGVGTFSGSEDHVAILNARPGALVQYRYAPVVFERAVALPAGLTFAVASSGVHAEKTGAARGLYNRLATTAADAAAVWRRATGRDDPHLAATLGSSADAAERLDRLLREADPALARRAAHFAAESETLVPAAGDALAAGDLATFGAQVDRSQHLAETGLGNQTPETVFLARAARDAGAHAASAFGAGFGGAVWALVDADGIASFVDDWRRRYAARFPHRRGRFLVTGAAPPARRLLGGRAQ